MIEKTLGLEPAEISKKEAQNVEGRFSLFCEMF